MYYVIVHRVGQAPWQKEEEMEILRISLNVIVLITFPIGFYYLIKNDMNRLSTRLVVIYLGFVGLFQEVVQTHVCLGRSLAYMMCHISLFMVLSLVVFFVGLLYPFLEIVGCVGVGRKLRLF